MTAEALDTEYENGVADILAYLAGEAADVRRNVRLLGKRSGSRRQIDVLVNGRLFGAGDATMVVDCKRYSKSVDVNHVATFVGLVDDVGADIGLLVTTLGITPAAQQYADSIRGIRLDILSIADLAAWVPRGTFSSDFAVPATALSEAVRVARRAGFRIKPVGVEEWRGDVGVGFSAFRYLGSSSPPAAARAEAREQLLEAFRRAQIPDLISLGSGVIINGGTPAHRYLEITVRGVRHGRAYMSRPRKTSVKNWMR